MTGLLALMALCAAACGGAAVKADPTEGRLSRSIINGELTECVFDAEVTLEPGGVVKDVVKIGVAAEGEIEPGMVVEGAAAVFPNGAGIPVPVHLDGEGVLRGSYQSCEAVSEDGTPGAY